MCKNVVYFHRLHLPKAHIRCAAVLCLYTHRCHFALLSSCCVYVRVYLCVCWLNVAEGDSWLWCARVNNTVHASNSMAAELRVCVCVCVRMYVCGAEWGLCWLVGVNPLVQTGTSCPNSSFLILIAKIWLFVCDTGINAPSVCRQGRFLWPSCIMLINVEFLVCSVLTM